MPWLLLGSALCRFQVFSLVLTAVATASDVNDFTTSCGAEAGLEESRREHSEVGAVLLQLKAAGNAAVAGKSDPPAEQLEQYAKLKQTLAQSKESALIMNNIDKALDGKRDSAAALANDVQTLDDVLKIQDSLPAQVADAGTLAHPKNELNPEMSLLEQSATTRTKNAPDAAIEGYISEIADADKVNKGDVAPAADTDGNISEAASSNLKSAGYETEAVHAAAADVQSMLEAADEGEAEVQSAPEVDDDDAESEEPGDEEAAEEKKAQKLSMLSLRDALEISREPLDEDGYLDVAGLRNNKKMELFVERLCAEMGFVITDPGGLKGMVPYYSGRKSTQSFEILQKELRSTVGSSEAWLMKPRHKRIHKGGMMEEKADVGARHRHHHPHRRAKDAKSGKGAKGEKDAALVEEDAETADATNASQVSLLGIASTRVARAAHKVPDVALALFGSRNVFFVITIALAACLFCLDERNRTRNPKYEDLLNMSPEPPPHKEDPAVAASLKVLRGGAGGLK